MKKDMYDTYEYCENACVVTCETPCDYAKKKLETETDLRSKEKVDWRFEFKRDNIFNIFCTAVLSALYVTGNGAHMWVILMAMGFINFSSLRFFHDNKYY